MTFVLAHLSDLHFAPLPRPRLGELMGKRLQGYLSWLMTRRNIHRRRALDALADDLAGQRHDHVAVTGDLTNISLPREFAATARWLERLGAAPRVTVIPGNHDAFVRVPWACALGLWAERMSDGHMVPNDGEDGHAHLFPTVRMRGPTALIGLSSARPTRPFVAGGRLGQAQRDRLAKVLRETRNANVCRVVMVHHPPFPLPPRRKALWDAAEFQDLVSEEGAELVLHGHIHRFDVRLIAGRHGDIPVVGAPSASAWPSARFRVQPAQYHLYEIARVGAGWRIEMRMRRYEEADHGFRDTGVRILCREDE